MGNKYNLYDNLLLNYKDTLSTLKETSLDDNGNSEDQYLCNDNSLNVFNFDIIKDNKYHAGYKSPDAIYINNKQVFVIEFKNQNPCDINSINLKEKLETSVDFFKNKITYSNDYTFTFCLVYKKQSQQQNTQRYKQRLQSQKCCNLSDCNKNNCESFYQYIITKDVEFYKKEFDQLNCG